MGHPVYIYIYIYIVCAEEAGVGALGGSGGHGSKELTAQTHRKLGFLTNSQTDRLFHNKARARVTKESSVEAMSQHVSLRVPLDAEYHQHGGVSRLEVLEAVHARAPGGCESLHGHLAKFGGRSCEHGRAHYCLDWEARRRGESKGSGVASNASSRATFARTSKLSESQRSCFARLA